MKIYKRLALSLITFAFTWAQVAFAVGETDSQQNTAYSLKEKVESLESLKQFQDLGFVRIKDKSGNDLTSVATN